ncbi:MAG: AbgT family transporter [Lachnospiraceae bacterium]|nr:AbgT family transporter [Lachnospiraceae bacterium]
MLNIFTKKGQESNIKREQMHPMIMLVCIVILCALASYIIPAGTYERVYDAALDREIVDASSFTFIERNPTGIMDLLMSLTKGLQNAAGIIFFLLIVGGMFSILNATGALNVGIANLLKAFKGSYYFLIPVFMLLFGAGSALCGNFEEFLVFVPLVLACCMTLGLDSLVAVGIIFMAATAGYAGAITNPFTVGIAQQISGLELFSGMGLRVALFLSLEAASIGYIIYYANRIRKNPRLSYSYEYDRVNNIDKKIDLNAIPKLTVRQAFVIMVFAIGIGFSIAGIIIWGYYIDELSGIFLATGIVAGLVGGLNANKICEAFIKGCKDMILPCIMIGLANSAVVILQEANVLDTMLYGLSLLIAKFPKSIMAYGMFVAHELFNVVVPSGSAQASAVMPVFVPLSDANGISRQISVLSYQMGDAFTNIMAPTGGEILAALAICKVPFVKWVRFLIPLFILWWVIALAFIIIATQIGYV